MYSKEEIEKKIDSLTGRQNWMHNIPLPFDLFTTEKSNGALSVFDDEKIRQTKFLKLQQRGAKEGLFSELNLRESRVLDVACGEGKYSFILAKEAANVLGIDIDPLRIEKATFLNEVLDQKNVEFKTMDLYSTEFQQLPKFELALCFGLIHRLPDPFNLINTLADKVDSILFEWITAPNLVSQNVPWAFHNQGGLYEWMNAKHNFETPESAAKSRAGGGANRASYWYMSYGALETICQRAGLDNFIRFSRAPMYPDLSEEPENLTLRIMLLASKIPHNVLGRQSRNGLKKWPRPPSNRPKKS
jgi:SAM-dependent methyltransferase